MKDTKIELSKFKLLRERNEAKKQELDGKVIVVEYEVIDLKLQIRTSEVQNFKLLQGKERELNKLQMEIIMLNQRKGNLEHKLQSYDIIKEEKNLLKLNQEREKEM